MGEMQGPVGLRLIQLCAQAFLDSPSRGKIGKCRAQSQGYVQTCTSFCTDPPLTVHCAPRELSTALIAFCSHSLHRPAEVVVPDGALPAGGGVQSAPRPVRMELQQWTQSQNHQGTQWWTLHPPTVPPSPGMEKGVQEPWEMSVS